MQKIIRIEKELEGIILKDDTIDEFLELIRKIYQIPILVDLSKEKKIFIPEQVTLDENINYSNFHIGDEVAGLFYKSYKNSSDDEGESIEDWKLILNDFINGKYGVIIKDLCELLYK